MTKKIYTLIAILAFFILFALAFYLNNQKEVEAPETIEQSTQQSTSEADLNLRGNEDALRGALNLYVQKKQAGVDFSNGPCLGKVAEDWVLDIVHNPRQDVDNKPENQCKDLLDGKIKHFIELDPSGKLVRSR